MVIGCQRRHTLKRSPKKDEAQVADQGCSGGSERRLEVCATVMLEVDEAHSEECLCYFTSQVSPARKSLARSPGPRLAMTSLICWFITSS